jgi:hypothetical protein
MLKRHEVEILLNAGHSKAEVARLAGVSLCSVKRIAEEVPVVHVDEAAEREKRRIGRPSIVEDFRKLVVKILEEKPDLPSLEILRRVREAGYQGGKTALYALVASGRPKQIKPLIRFEGLPGEFSQHDFGEVDVTFLDGSTHRIHFFASRLKYSRLICVSVVKDQAVESLVRNLAEHLDRWGGAPLMCVFDRPKTVALKWQRNGEVTEWNPVFAYVMLELGVGEIQLRLVLPLSVLNQVPNKMGDSRVLQYLAGGGRTPGARQIQFRENTRIEEAVRSGCSCEGVLLDFTPPKAGENHLELLVSLPQHSGRAGKEERSQPPPSAWIRRTALVMRRPRILTAVTSSVRAALCAVVTSR